MLELWFFWSFEKTLNLNAVDGRNLAPVDTVVYPIIYRVSKTSQVVVWDFWTINSINMLVANGTLCWGPLPQHLNFPMTSWSSPKTSKRIDFFSKRELACLGAWNPPNHHTIVERCFLGGGNSFFFLFSPLFGEDSQFDEHIFQMGWNHQLVFFFKWGLYGQLYEVEVLECFLDILWVSEE